MTVEPWLFAVLLAVAALHLVAVGYAALNASGGAVTPGSAGDHDEVDADSVVCPDCDAVNERGYRFCRQCVAELPGPEHPVETAAPARNGNLL